MVRPLLIVFFSVVGCGAKFEGERPPESPPQLPADSTSESWQTKETSRKIIHEADITIEIPVFSGLEHRISRIVSDHGGYLAQVAVQRLPGLQLHGDWTARVPVDRYTSFLEAIGQLGVTTHFSQSTKEVTEEYVDLESRISNQKRFESRLLEISGRPTTEFQRVMEFEREVTRVRENIELMEGRRRVLADRIEMATVTMHVFERPELPTAEPLTFVARVGGAWHDAIVDVRVALEHVIVFAAAALPRIFFPVLLVGLCAFVYLRRSRGS